MGRIGWCLRSSAVALLLLAATVAQAADLTPGREYGPGSRIESPADGVSFSLPGNWMGGLPVGSPIFYVGSRTEAGAGLILMRNRATWEEAQSLLQQPQDLGGGVVLMPQGPGQRTQRGYEVRYSDGMHVGHAVARIGEAGNGIVVFFGGPAANASQLETLTYQTIDSVTFSTPRSTPLQEQWRGLLAGNMLRRVSSYYSSGLDGSYVSDSSSQTLHLCSDGSYTYLASSSSAIDGGGGYGYGASGYGSGGASDSGRWFIELMGDQVVLALQSEQGESSHHAMRYANDQTFLDGDRVYRVPSDRCQ